MRSKGSREQDSRARKFSQSGRRRRQRSSRALSLVALAIAASAFGAFSASASAQTDSTAVTIPGSPLTTYVGPRGECQSSYLVNGEIAGNYYYGGNGRRLRLLPRLPQSGQRANRRALQGKTFGFDGAAGRILAKPLRRRVAVGR